MENLEPNVEDEALSAADDAVSAQDLDAAEAHSEPAAETASVTHEIVLQPEAPGSAQQSLASSEEGPEETEVSPPAASGTPAEKPSLPKTEAAFLCYICGEPSSEICSRCTRDTCDNHICERCLLCSDCCTCDGQPR